MTVRAPLTFCPRCRAKHAFYWDDYGKPHCLKCDWPKQDGRLAGSMTLIGKEVDIP